MVPTSTFVSDFAYDSGRRQRQGATPFADVACMLGSSGTELRTKRVAREFERGSSCLLLSSSHTRMRWLAQKSEVSNSADYTSGSELLQLSREA